jgi:DNA-3-methyladenine glycosylase II
MRTRRGKLGSIEIPLRVLKPYDFQLTLRALSSFVPGVSSPQRKLRLAARIKGCPVVIEISEGEIRPHNLGAVFHPKSDPDQVRAIAEWVIFADLDLAPFYRLTGKDRKVADLTKRLHGLKPSRPVSLFEMAAVAITEQQLSLASAHAIRNRIIQKFGEPVEDLWVFPEPDVLARASPEKLRACGLSRQKSDYIQSLAKNIAAGELDIEILKGMDDDEARQLIMTWKGFGPWSADYILVRGLARADSVPLDDLGVRDVVGKYLLGGRRATREEVAEQLEPYRPYRGLLAFYLLADHLLEKAGLGGANPNGAA